MKKLYTRYQQIFTMSKAKEDKANITSNKQIANLVKKSRARSVYSEAR